MGVILKSKWSFEKEEHDFRETPSFLHDNFSSMPETPVLC